MTDHRDVVSSLLSWMGQCHPRDYVRWLRQTQPGLFGEWSEDDMCRELEAVLSEAWTSLAENAA